MSHNYLENKSWYFIASCIVTDRAKAKWLKYALKVCTLLRDHEKVYLSWCGSIQNGVIRQDFYTFYPELIPFQESIELLPEDPGDFHEAPWIRWNIHHEKIRTFVDIRRKAFFTRKNLVIQTGCDNHCTFCLTVQARGRHRSRPLHEILEEIREYIDVWGREVVLTGTNLGAWGSPSSNDHCASQFSFLIEKILRDTSIDRIRISSLGVEFCHDSLMTLFSETRINPYIHLSIQSASGKILSAMNRHYTREILLSVLTKIRNIDRWDKVIINLWADIIVWFPWETECDFRESLDLVQDFMISRLHAFPFSPHVSRIGVPAGKFHGQIPQREIQSRFLRITEVGKDAQFRFIERNRGKTLRVLVEKSYGTDFSWWSENYIFCNQQNFCPLPWSLIEKGRIIEGVLSPESTIRFSSTSLGD